APAAKEEAKGFSLGSTPRQDRCTRTREYTRAHQPGQTYCDLPSWVSSYIISILLFNGKLSNDKFSPAGKQSFTDMGAYSAVAGYKRTEDGASPEKHFA
ncbi:hypothetical protein A2U01_0045049, partial [Trifolium medium]|nr:hypothetical protein [Trifolium medium]